MAQPENFPIVKTSDEFFQMFNISKESFYILQYTKTGKLGWLVELPNKQEIRGTVSEHLSTQILECAKQHKKIEADHVFVRYNWNADGKMLIEPLWVWQMRPNATQLSIEYALVMLLNILNSKKQELYGDKAILYKLSDLRHHLNRCKQNECYHEFSIPKKNGKLRTISAPCHDLKGLQSIINLLLQEKYHPTAAAMGFVPGRSVADNARVHQGQNYVYNIDIKDFFPSISSGRVYTMLQLPPYSFDKHIASVLSDLCCHSGVLPQGAPTSPILTNIICERLDWRLSKLARRFKLKYTRYADDITFSGMENVFHADGEFVEQLQHYIAKEGFTINPEKTRLNTIGGRQEVTGLTVNAKANVSKRYIKTLRTMLHNWETLGLEEAQKRMAAEYGKDKRKIIKGTPRIENVIQGKLNYLKMVKGESDTTYKKLLARYDNLMDKDFGIHDILELWEKYGFERAAQAYIERIATPQSNDRKVMTLADFEEMLGKKVIFMPKSQIYNSQQDSDTHDDNSITEPAKSLLAHSFKIYGSPNRIVPTIDGQQYIGDIRLDCKDLNPQQNIFVSYTIYRGRKCYFFSNSNTLPCDNTKKITTEVLNLMEIECSTKEKFFKIIARMNGDVKDINKAITLLFDELNQSRAKNATTTDNVFTSMHKKRNNIHSPHATAEFFSLFNQRKGLKYLTHDFDNTDMTYKTLIEQCSEIVASYSERNDIPNSLIQLVRNFTIGGTWIDYSGTKQNEGFSSNVWRKWSSENDNIHPIRNIGNAEKTIQAFRHTIRIVAPDLKSIIESIIEKFPTFQFELHDLSKANFYTNVFILQRSLYGIIKDLTDYKDYSKIKIVYSPNFDGEYFVHIITITQTGAFSQIPIDLAVARFNGSGEKEGGFFADNALRLKGYCNWSVESLWDDQPYRWNLLRESTPEIENIDRKLVTGFSHILTFYNKN